MTKPPSPRSKGGILATSLPFVLSFLLLFLALLPAVTHAQPAAGGGGPDTAAGNGTATPSSVDEITSQLAPYASAIGGVIMALGIILAFSGKAVLRLYLAIVGFLAGAFTSYVLLERVAASGTSLGPNKEVIQLIVAIVAGILGVGLGLCAARLAVVAVGVLFGLALTMGLLSIPSVGAAIKPHLPSWGLALIVVAASVLLLFFLEPYVYIAISALLGALATAMGADLSFMKTGFDKEAVRCLTSPDPPKDFQGTPEMRPVLYVFVGVLCVGALSQLCLARRAARRRKAGGGGARGSGDARWDVEEGRGRDNGATARVYE